MNICDCFASALTQWLFCEKCRKCRNAHNYVFRNCDILHVRFNNTHTFLFCLEVTITSLQYLPLCVAESYLEPFDLLVKQCSFDSHLMNILVVAVSTLLITRVCCSYQHMLFSWVILFQLSSLIYMSIENDTRQISQE